MQVQAPSHSLSAPVRTSSFQLFPEEGAAGGGTAVADKRKIELTDTITVDGEEIEIGKLVKFAQDAAPLVEQVEELEEFKEAAVGLVNGKGDRKANARVVLSSMGFQGADLEDRISQMDTSGAPPADTTAGGGKPAAKTGKGLSMDDLPQELRELVEEGKAARAESRHVRRRAADRELREALKSAVDNNPKLAKIRESLGKTDDGKKRLTSASEAMANLVRKETIARLERRSKDSGGAFQEEWIEEEAKAAADTAAETFGAVIGDPTSLGRTPGTDEGMDSFLAQNSKPVESPKFEKTDDRGSVATKANDFTTNALLGAVAEVARGGPSKA